MPDDHHPYPTPFGMPGGPALSTPALLSAFLSGAGAGSSPEAHIEDPLLLASDHPIAIRTDGAVLVRDDAPPVAEGVRALLCRELAAAGMVLADGESVLAAALASELAAPRGYEWNLWAHDPDEARAVLTHRAIGVLPGLFQTDTASWEAAAEMDALIERFQGEA